VTKLLIFIAATIGGSIGWWLGAFVGIMTAFMVSIVGTAAGVYIARRWASGYIG
jgi:cadmium resistance protein CadD (predicted permease)